MHQNKLLLAGGLFAAVVIFAQQFLVMLRGTSFPFVMLATRAPALQWFAIGLVILTVSLIIYALSVLVLGLIRDRLGTMELGLVAVTTLAIFTAIVTLNLLESAAL